MEEYGHTNARRCPARPGDRRPNFLEDPRTLQKRWREVPRSYLAPDLELQRPIEPAPGRGIEGNQWQGARRSRGSRDEAANQGRPAASWLSLLERRRYDVLRALDLLRPVDRKREPDSTAPSFALLGSSPG